MLTEEEEFLDKNKRVFGHQETRGNQVSLKGYIIL
jgi:hypothetical protein